MNKNYNSPGINSEAVKDSYEKYQKHVKERILNGHQKPLQEGILIWDETKVF